MPGLVRKLLIFAAIDGLILQPAPPRNHPPSTQQAIKIDYKGNIAPLLKDRREEITAATALEAHGVLGLLKIASSHFLISIASREQVAQIRGKPIYAITDVVLIPLSSQEEASKVITSARETLKRQQRLAEISEDSESEPDDEGTGTISDNESIADSLPDQQIVGAGSGSQTRRTSVAEDVIEKKGMYGRFVGHWFSKKGWNTEKRKNQGMSSEEDLQRKVLVEPQTDPAKNAKEDENEPTPETSKDVERDGADIVDPPLSSPEEVSKALEGPTDQTTMSLLPKLLRTTKLYFSSKSFFFSYDYDLSRRLDKQTGNLSSQPLHQQYDPLYFWNFNLIRPFIDAGQHTYAMPVIQGFVGQRAFSVDVSDSSSSTVLDSSSKPEDVLPASKEDLPSGSTTPAQVEPEDSSKKDFLLTLISRRSVKRAGLRYLRRGVDEDGNVANSVESEQLLSTPTWDTARNKIYSFTQYRGSIPLFFSQSPYSLKPWPVLYGSPEANEKAFKLHFSNLAARYGGVQAVSLVDKHGSEAKIGEAFEKHAARLNKAGGIDGKGKELGFEWFDFHYACRGMRFENVSILMDTLKPILTPFGWTVQDGSGLKVVQSGVLRTNCMDCLDRTNVVQSAAGRAALEGQLAEQNIKIDLQKDPKTAWFNTLWADNGDAISRQYAGTAALKGDYTRTRHRKISGALTDFGLTLSRYYNNIVNDYFAQAVIDYLLGRATDKIFSDFEADMMTHDYAIDLRKVRQAAIARSAEIVIESPEEDLIHGWALSCPHEANSLRAFPFEECILLLTEKALYFCRLDWTTEKVKEFERVEFECIKSIARGTYITSTLAKKHMDENTNVGFVIRFETGGKGLVRVNTRSLSSAQPENNTKKDSSTPAKAPSPNDRILAFKALPPKSTFATKDSDEDEVLSEKQSVKIICDEIARIANKHNKANAGASGHDSEQLEVEEKDIISLADAKKATGYFEQLGYSLKKLVWAS